MKPSIAELHVASNFEAEYGRSAGGVVNIVTKSGTNQIHGSLFEFFRNNALDARNFFDKVMCRRIRSTPINSDGALGGPIIKDKTFFFINYEGMREIGCPDPRLLVFPRPMISRITRQRG